MSKIKETSDISDRIANLSPEKHLLLALWLSGRKEQEGSQQIPVASERHSQTPLPLSYAQERLWFLDQLEPGNIAYNIPAAYSFTGDLNSIALEQALDEVIRRHEALRTTFIVSDEQPRQVINPHHPLALRVVDLEGLPAARKEAEIRKLAIEEGLRPFDLASGPLIRAALARIGPRNFALLLTMHHIVSDGWSIGVLIREVETFYNAFSAGTTSPLPELTIQYADFAIWQRNWLQGDALESRLSYWKRQLDGQLPALELPTDHPRPTIQSFRGSAESFALCRAKSDAVRSLSRQMGASLFMTTLAIFKTLLRRYTGQEDLIVGAPVANRNRKETEGLIGFFVNTLALRSNLSGHPTFRELLARLRQVTLDAFAHQDLPLEKLVEILRPGRDLSRTPLFQVLFLQQNTPQRTPEVPNLEIDSLNIDWGTAKFDLTMSIDDTDRGLIGTLEYNLDLFDHSTIARSILHFQTLLDGILADPDERLSDLSILTTDEQRQLLADWNDTETRYDESKLVHEYVELQVERAPDAVALVFEGQQLTYLELNRRANQLAHHLRGLGVGSEGRVAICVERSVEMVVGLLAILKAGGAYVPLDPSYPAERLAYMLEDSAPVVLLTNSAARVALSDRLPAIPILDLESDAAQWAGQSELDLKWSDAGVGARSLAYIIYTSGSTGVPKGVMVDHGGVVNLLCSMRRIVSAGPEDCVLALTTLAFDIAGLELYLPLISGARIELAGIGNRHDPVRLAERIAWAGVTAVQATPAAWRMLLDAGRSGMEGIKALCGGEALSVEQARRLKQRVGKLWNVYGPTETTIWSTVAELDAATLTEGVSHITIGRPIANTSIYILDSHLCPAPIGVSGEMHIGGAGVAWGYFNRPELTAERFLPDPFSREVGARIYKTGDLSRWRPDGQIEFLGRNDYQVKIRGFRIELGEIETALAQHPRIRECVVVAREDAPEDKRLAAYVVPQESDEAADPAEPEVTFSLFYFGADTYQPEDKYRLYLESAKFADQNGFEAIWTPERHFHEVGGLYPNPAILSAALAGVTKRIHLRSGSVVLPLHHPARVAEEWSVVDNLSHGRVGVSIASGWHPRDFALAPGNYAERREVMASSIKTLKALWRGETLSFEDGAGKQSEISIYPKPIQPELPLWITAAGSRETFIQAGRMGANLLTHLLGQTVEEVAANIELYRDSLARHGYDPHAGRVTLMIHTFLAEDFDQTLERARGPFIRYMRSHLGLLEAYARSLEIPVEEITDENVESIVSFAFDRYSRTASLIGTPQTCLPIVARLGEAGVDELACLIDWIEAEEALESLAHLQALRRLSRTASPGARALRQRLMASLPDYMVPASFTFLDRLPLTPNGKLDRRALPVPEGGDYPRGSYEPPVGETEIKLARIWAELLMLERVGRHNNFFELGGHSLLATQVILRIREIFHVELPLLDLFQAPLISETAKRIDQLRPGARHESTPIQPAPRGEKRLLSFAQRRMWVVNEVDPNSPAYSVPFAIQINGELNIATLQDAMNEIVRRHEILRTTFRLLGDEPEPIVSSSLHLDVPVVDLRGLTQDYRARQVSILAGENSRRTFSLSRGPLLHTTLLRCDEREYILLLNMHHIVCDGWAINILFRELGLLYEAFSSGVPSPLTELPIQYSDYSAWQRQFFSADVIEQKLGYWRKQLARSAPLKLPVDRPYPRIRTMRGAAHPFSLPRTLSDQLKQLGRRSGATLFMTLLTAFKILLQWYSRQDYIVVGTDIANRNRIEIENLIGFFVNQLALGTDLSGDLSFVEALNLVRDRTLEAYANQDLPFDKLVEALNPDRTEGHIPFFQIKLIQQTPPLAAAEIPGIKLQLMEQSHETATVDLLLNIIDSDHGIEGALEYSTDLFEPGTAAHIVDNYQHLLRYVVKHPEASRSSIGSMLELVSRQQLGIKEQQFQKSRLSRLKDMKEKHALSRKVSGEVDRL